MSDLVNVLVEVTQEDIDSNSHTCVSCPVHRAISRHLNPESSVRVFPLGANYYTNGLYRDYWRHPAAVQKWIRDYDHDKPVKPISATLQIPRECLKVKA